MRDLNDNIAVSQMLSSLIRTADATSASIDLQGFDSAECVVNVGVSGDTLSGTVYWDFILQESDDDTVFTVVADADALSNNTLASGIFQVVDVTGEESTAYKVGYIGGKRYVHVLADATGTHSTGTSFGVIGIKGNPNQSGV